VLTDLSLVGSVVAFVAAAGVLLVVGVRVTRLVDALADRTGIGEASPEPCSSGPSPPCRDS
jgi:hypothetical protein